MKKQKKLTKAQREAQFEYEKMMRRWDKIPKFSSSPSKKDVEHRLVLDLSAPPGRETVRHPSKVTPGGSTAKVSHHTYTGDKILGIAQMSKSNAVPVFAKQEAVDIARMRRN